MRLVTYLKNKKDTALGLHVGEMGAGQIIDLNFALDFLKITEKPADMLTIISDESRWLPPCQKILQADSEKKLPPAAYLEERNTTLLSPIPRPLSMRDGYAFRQHVESARKGRGLPMIPEFDHFPVFYFTNHLAVTGPGDIPVSPKAQERLDFELEAAIVIGKPGKNISASQADQHIFGYMIMNDWSARELQTQEMKLNLGPAKGKDFATSLGPYLVTRDELQPYAVVGPQGERHRLGMRAFINDKQYSNGNMQDMNWTFAQIIERASYGVQLHSGEVIGSGTVGTGCLMELNLSKITDNVWLKPGDTIRIEIDHLGTLENRIVEA